MKFGYLMAILLVAATLVLAGCATPSGEGEGAPAEGEAEVPAEGEGAPVEGEAEVPAEGEAEVAEGEGAAMPAATTEIAVLAKGFDPAEDVTVNVGDTVTFRATEGKHMLTVGGHSLGTIEEGSVKEQTFDKAGTYKVFDIFTKKTTNVIVVAAAAE